MVAWYDFRILLGLSQSQKPKILQFLHIGALISEENDGLCQEIDNRQNAMLYVRSKPSAYCLNRD